MKLIFFGSPDFAKIILDKLHSIYPISVVVTQPDRPKGRKGILSPTPVKEWIKQQNNSPITLITQTDIKKIYSSIHPFTPDLIIVAAYGPPFLSREILGLPKYGCLNIHPSLLPDYRGASPIQFAILFGEEKTGVTIFKMNEGVDKGEIISQKSCSISSQGRSASGGDTFDTLIPKLATVGAKLLLSTIPKWINGEINPIQQLNSSTPYARKLTKEDGFLPFSILIKAVNGEAYDVFEIPFYKPYTSSFSNFKFQISNFIQGMHPWPGVWTILPNGKRLKILSVSNSDHLNAHSDNSDRVMLTKIQLEGKKPITGKKEIASLLLAMTK
jgi:methionyl-tRNA formyltransferase